MTTANDVLVADRWGRPANGRTLTANERIETLERLVTLQSALISRRDLAVRLGRQFSGDRKVYEAAGYPTTISFDDYLARFRRQDIAKRVVSAAPNSTWRHPPKILDGADEDAARPDTDFARAWEDLTSITRVEDELADSFTVWHYLRRADLLAGLGQYSVILVGVRDGRALQEPLQRTSVEAGGLLYLSVFSEQDATIEKLVDDPGDRRFGRPEYYKIRLAETIQERVHASRVIHVAEDLLTDDVYGRPRAEAVYNRLIDLEKILPAAAEAAWKLMYKGMVLTTQEGYELPDDEVTNDKVEEYVHGLRRVLELEGLDVTFEGGEAVDPAPLVDVMLTFISVATGIPKRILAGSERGELASSQDEANWAARMAERQGSYAEPVIVRPLVNRLVYTGVLPRPESGAYSLTWRPLFELNELERAQVAETYASAIRQAAPAGAPDLVVAPGEFRERFLGLPAESEMEVNALLDIEEGMGET